MNYSETIEYLYSQMPMFERQGAAGYKEGLSNTLALDEHFGHPHRRYKTIHVAGTNGKGSCSHTLAAILQCMGYKVGLYTSPHLVDFSERIRVNGKPVSQQYVIDFVEQERSFFEPLHPSFFEVTTAMAFKYFADSEVDIAVIEVGLGGRLDCTNIITPVLSVITNISLDHTQFLGDTLEKIAVEKAGIIKRGVPVVIGESTPETRPVFESKAADCNAQITFAEEKKPEDFEKSLDVFELKGCYQWENLRTILAAFEVFLAHRFNRFNGFKDMPCSCKKINPLNSLNPCEKNDLLNLCEKEKALEYALAHVCSLTGLRGRWETLQTCPETVCDTGHNEGGWRYISRQLNSIIKRKLIVFGMVADKDIDAVISLLPKDAEYFFTQPSTHRALSASDIAEKAARFGLQGEVIVNPKEAYAAALKKATADDFIFIGGSNYLVSDILTE